MICFLISLQITILWWRRDRFLREIDFGNVYNSNGTVNEYPKGNHHILQNQNRFDSEKMDQIKKLRTENAHVSLEPKAKIILSRSAVV